MKKKNILLTFIMSFVMICLFATVTRVSAADYYQTNKANVPIWSQASSSSTKKRTIAAANTVLSVVGSTKNSSGNLWYQLSDGTWVFSGNVTRHYHSYSGGICTNSTCRYQYPYSVSSYYATVEVKNTSGAKIWSRPYSNNSTHYRTEAYQKILYVVAKTTNQEGHVWYKLSDGCWVYSDNVKVHSHSYSGGICTNGYCRYEYPYSVSSYYATVEVKNTSGAKVWSRPYSNNSTHYRTEAYQKILSVVAKTTNQENHVWYKLSDGSWVYSDNVKTHSHSYKGGICSNGYCKYEYPYSVSSYSATVEVTNKSGAKIWSRPYSNNSTHYRTEALGKVFKVTSKTTNQEGSVWYKLSDRSWVFSENVKKHSHSYTGGICTNSTCKYEYPYTVSYYSATVEVANKNGAKIWSRPYSHNSSHQRTDALGKVLKVTGKTTNQEGKLWYKLSDGRWVFSENVKKHSHSYKGGMCTNATCKYEYPYTVTAHSETRYVINKDGAKIWSRPYSNNSTHKRTDSYGKALTITAKTTNQDGHLWYRLSDGSWVFSENTGKRYSVKYNAKGGSSAPGTQYVLEGATLKLTTAKPIRVGYTFSGWSSSSDAKSVTHKAGTSYSFKKSTTLYAVWKTCKHTYTGGICSGCSYEYPLSITSLSATFVVTNSSGAAVRNRPYSQNATTVRTEKYNKALTVKAYTTNQEGNKWYQLSDGNWIYGGNIARRYTVSYNANGGKGAPSSQTFLSGKTLTLSKTAPTRVGYVFKGWATSKDSLKADYVSGSSYSAKKDLKLYAVWAKCSHKKYTGGYCNSCNYEYPLKETAYSGTFVVTNDNGAPVWSRPYSDKSTKIKTYDKDKALKVTAKVRNIGSDGKSGNLWYKLSDGSWVFSGNVTERFTVKYSANKGNNAPSSQNFLSGKSVTITKSKPTREEYIFKGWATSSSSSKVSYKAGDKYSKEKNITLYAVWTKCEHKYNDSGVCTTCKYKYKITVDTSFTGSYVVIESKGALIRNTPYSISGSAVRTAKKNEVLKVTGKAVNAHKNVWYKLSDGNWVYSERVTSGYKVTYKANGGNGAPAATGFVSGKLTVSSTAPKRDGYVFMGWATSSTATTASYKTGDTYDVKKNITLYAVWQNCTHNYKNNYGICKTCKSEFPLTVKSTSEIVFAVNNKNGTTTYKRPYSKTSEKVKTLKNGNYVLVTGYATNANDEVWYKLKDGSWIKKSEVKKQATYNSVDSIPYKYALLMIGDTADGGIYRTETVQGVKYAKYFDSKNTFFLKLSAFEGSSKNTQLSTANKNLTNAVNSRSSATENFIYNEKTTKKIKAVSYGCGFNNHETHNHIIWEISALTAKAGISGSDGIYFRCQNDAKTLTLEYCTDAKHFDHVWAHTSSVYPKFTVSATPYAENGEAVGWFTDFSMLGKGFKSKKFAIEDYVDLFSCAVKGVASVGKFVLAPTPDNALKALKGTWKFATDATSATKSTSYSSDGKNSLTYVDSKTSTAYRTYKMSVESPINLQSPNDFLEAHIYLHKLNKNQEITVKLTIK